MENKPIGVQRKRIKGYKLPENTVCVNRGTKYGNPFKVEKFGLYWTVGARAFSAKILATEFAVSEYENWLNYNTEGTAVAYLAKRDLVGKNLACFCPLDEPCHRNTLLRIANG